MAELGFALASVAEGQAAEERKAAGVLCEPELGSRLCEATRCLLPTLLLEVEPVDVRVRGELVSVRTKPADGITDVTADDGLHALPGRWKLGDSLELERAQVELEGFGLEVVASKIVLPETAVAAEQVQLGVSHEDSLPVLGAPLGLELEAGDPSLGRARVQLFDVAHARSVRNSAQRQCRTIVQGNVLVKESRER